MPPVIINGSVRSGTTWLYEILSKEANYHPIYEPDNFLLDAKKLSIRNRYLDPAKNYPDINNFFELLLNNKINHLQHDFNVYSRLLNSYLKFRKDLIYFKNKSKNPLIKFTRAHFFLPYLQANFNPKIILLFRNPYAVVESAMRVSMINVNFEELFDERQMDLFEQYPEFYNKLESALDLLDYKKIYNPRITKKERKAKLFIIRWAFENSFLLKMIKSGKVNALLLFYEEIFENPQIEIKRLYEYLGLKSSMSVLLDASTRRSFSANTISFEKKDHLMNWKKYLNDDLVIFINKIIEIFEIDIYREDYKPNTSYFKY